MARPGLMDHPKFRRLCHILGEPVPHVLGYLECLWNVAYVAGNPVIGDSLDVELAAQYPGQSGKLCEALLQCRLIDDLGDNRYGIHDLFQNAPDYVKKRHQRELERQDNSRQPSSAVVRRPAPNGSTPSPSPSPAPTPSPAHSPNNSSASATTPMKPKAEAEHRAAVAAGAPESNGQNDATRATTGPSPMPEPIAMETEELIALAASKGLGRDLVLRLLAAHPHPRSLSREVVAFFHEGVQAGFIKKPKQALRKIVEDPVHWNFQFTEQSGWCRPPPESTKGGKRSDRTQYRHPRPGAH